MFELVEHPIDHYPVEKRFHHPSVGGVVTFEGRVRNTNEGKDVRSLEYEAYKEMSIGEGQKIMAEVKDKFDLIDLYCVHRVGHLKIEELAVWIITTAVHRRDAFLATQYIIDEVKLRLPIWKKEHYSAGDSQWIFCPQCYQRSRENHEHQ